MIETCNCRECKEDRQRKPARLEEEQVAIAFIHSGRLRQVCEKAGLSQAAIDVIIGAVRNDLANDPVAEQSAAYWRELYDKEKAGGDKLLEVLAVYRNSGVKIVTQRLLAQDRIIELERKLHETEKALLLVLSAGYFIKTKSGPTGNAWNLFGLTVNDTNGARILYRQRYGKDDE